MLESKWLLDKQCFECVLWLPAGQAYLHCNYTLYDTGNRYSDSHTEIFWHTGQIFYQCGYNSPALIAQGQSMSNIATSLILNYPLHLYSVLV